MICSRSKVQSKQLIEDLRLNAVRSSMFKASDFLAIDSFLNSSQSELFNIRDPRVSGKFLYGLSKGQVVASLSDYDIVHINDSMKPYDGALVLQGDLEITKDSNVTATLDDTPNRSQRDAVTFPKYNVKRDLKDGSVHWVHHLDEVIDYCIQHNLFDIVVEFTLFNEKVGCNNENLIIWELRNY